MDIYIAPKSGFCFGVKEAIDKTFNSIKENEGKNIYTYGPLIHNNQVIHKLDMFGVKSIDNIEDAQNSILIIRSHGVPLRIYEKAKELNVELIDATCPFVRKVQKKAQEYYNMGYKIIIIGNPNHPEVIGINGWCNNEATVVENLEQVKKLSFYENICVVAQTTLTSKIWGELTGKLREKCNNFKAFNTICLATKERQEACKEISKLVNCMVVIGGLHSSNTQKLFSISKEHCDNTIHIESADDLPIDDLLGCKKVGITAGASTPEWVIDEVIKKLENKGGRIIYDYGK